MSRIGFTLILAILFLDGVHAFAAANFSFENMNVTVQPIVGYEFTHLSQPTDHAKALFIYGARARAGNKLLSGELEYTRGSDSDTYPLQGLVVNTTKENLRLGIVTTYPLNPYIELLGRAGGQASREKTDSISIGTASSIAGTWTYHPYLGVGLQGAIWGQFSLTAELTYVFNSLEDFSRNDIHSTVGVKIDLNSK